MRVETDNVLHSLVFLRLPSGKSAEELSKSEGHSVLCMFRHDLTMSMVSVAQNTESNGVASIQTGGTDPKLLHPKWLKKDLFRRFSIDKVMARIDQTGPQPTTGKSGGSGRATVKPSGSKQ